jgi:y4mF family transcriptional regulator
MSTTQQIADAVRATRKRLGLRQDQLAAAAGVGVHFLVELERGKASAQLGKTLAVLDALGLNVSLVDRLGRPLDIEPG